MIASCGPALRNSLANIAIRKMIARIIRPAMTIVGFSCINLDFSLARVASPLLQLQVARGVYPGLDVRNSFFIARDHYLGALGNLGAILAACATDAAGSFLGIDQLPGAAGPYGNAQAAQHAGHVVIDGIERSLPRHQDLGEKQEDHGRSADPAESCNSQRENEPDAVIPFEQIAGAAKPGEEGGDGAEIEPRQIDPTAHATATHAARRVGDMDNLIEVQVRKMKMHAAGKERKGA